VANLNAASIVGSTLAGLLGYALKSVNLVNAAALASSNGIALSTIRHDRQCDHETLLRVTIKHDGGERTIAGTQVEGNKPRIIEVQSIAIELDFPENLLNLCNYDKPGFIGYLGTLCCRHGLNIATFHLGRRNVAGEVDALVEVVGALPAGVLDEIKSLPQVVRADSLEFSAQD
jgi:D-3-phosphoglycerate dehydrogenase